MICQLMIADAKLNLEMQDVLCISFHIHFHCAIIFSCLVRYGYQFLLSFFFCLLSYSFFPVPNLSRNLYYTEQNAKTLEISIYVFIADPFNHRIKSAICKYKKHVVFLRCTVNWSVSLFSFTVWRGGNRHSRFVLDVTFFNPPIFIPYHIFQMYIYIFVCLICIAWLNDFI